METFGVGEVTRPTVLPKIFLVFWLFFIIRLRRVLLPLRSLEDTSSPRLQDLFHPLRQGHRIDDGFSSSLVALLIHISVPWGFFSLPPALEKGPFLGYRQCRIN